MPQSLWTFAELLAAAAGRAEAAPNQPITGFSIDTRSLKPGDVFVALKDQRDGHDFVPAAFKAGAAAALVSNSYARQPGDGVLIHVDEPLRALERVAAAARARLAPSARVLAVTGSAGKTGTKEMLRACLSRAGQVHASEKSFNNHWGVPLTLASMPAAADFGVFEIGMNHAGEILPLTKLVRPHAAVITTVEPVHLEHFSSVEAIADAKAEIFEGLEPGGSAIIKLNSPHAARLSAAAEKRGARVLTFGFASGASIAAPELYTGDEGTRMNVRLGSGETLTVAVAIPGRHIAENALAVVAALKAIGAPLEKCITALGSLPPPPGRGARSRLPLPGGEALLIDESYNANPASMQAALATLAEVPRAAFPRRVVVLGDMLELGPQSGALHRGLSAAVAAAGTDVFFACGPMMRGLFDAIPEAKRGHWAATAAELQPLLAAALRAGDVVMIKASNGTRLGAVVESLKARFGVQPVSR